MNSLGSRINSVCKRGMDIFLSILGMIICAPQMLLIALAIRLDSSGEIIFSQERLGLNGSRFKLHKFRKFPADWGTKGPGVTVAGDARMTRIGNLLERTKFDELPQFWNIFKGEMTFVGPRPETVRYADLFTGKFVGVLDYVPGIFGPNQIEFRNESAMYPPDKNPEEFYREVLFRKKARNDLAYFKKANCLTDIMWIIKGVWASLAGVINWRRMLGLHVYVVLMDILAVEIAWTATKLFRYGFTPGEGAYDHLITGLWLFPAIVTPTMILLGAYRNPVRYFTVLDALRCGCAAASGWVLGFLFFMGFFHRGESMLLAFLGIFLLVPLITFPKAMRKIIWQRKNIRAEGGHKNSVLLYGAGHRGAALASLLHYGFSNTELVGFLDDDDELRGRYVQSHKVLGCERDLTTIHAVHQFSQLWLSYRPDGSKRRRIQIWCNENQVPLVVVPEIEPFAGLE